MAKQKTASAFEIGGVSVAPGTTERIDIPVARLPTKTLLSMPVTVVHGRRPGPCVWISAAIHGDELSGVETIRRVLERLDPLTQRGTVLAVPIVNVFGFIHQTRYLPDGRDLNRSFPGSKNGSLASQLAYMFMKEIVGRCTHGIDLHTATHHRTNYPQVRADLDDPETLRCAKAFAAPVMLHARIRDQSLRAAATKKGICVLLFEGGEASRFEERSIRVATDGVLRVLAAVSLRRGSPPKRTKEPIVVRKVQWVRASRSGIARMHVKVGQRITKGEKICTIADAFGDSPRDVKSPANGVIIGSTLNPLINRGDGLVNIGFTD